VVAVAGGRRAPLSAGARGEELSEALFGREG
jgi:hypothetical protein